MAACRKRLSTWSVQKQKAAAQKVMTGSSGTGAAEERRTRRTTRKKSATAITAPVNTMAASSQGPPQASNQSPTVPRRATPRRTVSRPTYEWKTRW